MKILTMNYSLAGTPFFNPGFTMAKDGSGTIVIARRFEGSPRKITATYLGRAGCPPVDVKDITRLPLGPYDYDARLFYWDGNLWASYTRYVPRSTFREQISLVRIDDDLRAVEHLNIAVGPWMQTLEKNWGFFERNGKLHAVYKTDPLTILEFERSGNELSVSNRWTHAGRGTEARGGTPPVLVGTTFEMIAHVKVSHTFYYALMVEFEAEPPYAPIKYGKRLEFELPETIVFPVGYAVRGNERIVSYGYQDNESRCAIW